MPEPANDRLTWSEQGAFPVAIVCFRGVLDGGTVSTAQNALLKALTDQPTAVVIDVGDLECPEPLWLSIFSSVARRASEWPGSAVLLCAARPSLARHLLGVNTRRLPAFDTRAEALRYAHDRPVPPRFRLTCLPEISAPSQARKVAVDAFWRWEVPAELILSAEVVVSELVTNAVRHARTRAELTLQLGDRYLHVAVRDGSIKPPHETDDALDLAHLGHGLRIVGLLATAWGSHPTADGKVVWATFRLPR